MPIETGDVVMQESGSKCGFKLSLKLKLFEDHRTPDCSKCR